MSNEHSVIRDVTNVRDNFEPEFIDLIQLRNEFLVAVTLIFLIYIAFRLIIRKKY